jgi:ABC-type multidrug transport system fused ATPase/permease subunit
MSLWRSVTQSAAAPGRARLADWRWLVALVVPYRGTIAVIVILALAMAGLTALAPWPLKFIVDGVLPSLTTSVAQSAGQDLGFLSDLDVATVIALAALGYFVIFIMQRAVAWCRGLLQSVLGVRLVFDVRAESFARIQNTRLESIERQRVGDVAKTLVMDVGGVRELVQSVVAPAVTAALTVSTVLAVIFMISPAFAMLAAVVSTGYAGVIRWFAPIMLDRSYEYHDAEGAIAANAEHTLSIIPLTRAYSSEGRETKRFERATATAVGAFNRSIRLELLFQQIVGGVSSIGTASAMALGAVYVLNGEFSVGTLLVMTSYIAQLYGPLETLVYTSSGVTGAFAKLKRVQKLRGLVEETHAVPAAAPVHVAGSPAMLEFEDVGFGYEAGRELFGKSDLRLRRGELIVIRGENGSGKSTILSLILRLYAPRSGQIRLFGTPVERIPLQDYRQNFSYMPQATPIFAGTIRDNLVLAGGPSSEDEIMRIAKAVGLEAFIRGLPDGLDTIIDADFPGLSGGQRQRLGLARALLRPSQCLLLDEPTSALDPDTEALVLKSLGTLGARRCILMATHSDAAANAADRVYELKGGNLVEHPRPAASKPGESGRGVARCLPPQKG